MQCDSVEHKCQLSDLPLMRWHLWQEERKLLLCKTHTQKKLLLRTDKETLKGIKSFYISYICKRLLKSLTVYLLCVRVVNTGGKTGNRTHISASKICANLKHVHILLMLRSRWVCTDPDDCSSCQIRQCSVTNVTLNCVHIPPSVLQPGANELSSCLDCITGNYTLQVPTDSCSDFAVVYWCFYYTSLFNT